MKTKELIQHLQQLDPTGETHVCVDNIDIYSIGCEPAYWDGTHQIIIHDESAKPYYSATGVRFSDEGHKIVIKTLSWDDILLDVPDAKFEYSSDRVRERHEPEVEAERTRTVDMLNSIVHEHFVKYAKNKFPEISPELALAFAKINFAHDTKLPKPQLTPFKSNGKIYKAWNSVNDRWERLWDSTVTVNNYTLVLKDKENTDE